ncbi:ABC transporter substrate binding protein [Bradyrhizobium sp. RT5a]|uniref:sensor histidine kinase n=1 Tax=unclassified Bradyrhizobium TaxID=2631580 RepID=UPI003391F17F
MLFWLPPSPWRTRPVRNLTAALTVALLVATTGQSYAADPAPKRVLMLHSFGLRFKPWTVYAEAIRSEISRHSKVEFQDHSLVVARLNNDKSDGPFVDYLHALNTQNPPDLIMSIGAPAANFVQRHRKELFPNTPMVLTAVERRRVAFDKLGENDTVVGSTNNTIEFFENILSVLPLTTTIAVVIGASPSETYWLEETRRRTAPLAGRVQIRYYNELSFEEIQKDAATLPPHSAIFWLLLNVDAAGVAYEGPGALLQLSKVANAPIFTHDQSFFGDGIVGGPMHSVVEQSTKAATVALRILNGEKIADIKPSFVDVASPIFDWRQMQRWGIAERDLPPGSAVYFREPTLWERYWWQITFTIALVLAQAGLIALLLFEHRRRQFAEVQSRQRMAELAHVNRFATAGELTASIAHEINQPLGSILTNAETAAAILQSQRPDIAALSDVVELREIVNDIVQDDRRATEVIRRMRSLLKKAPFELKKLDLNEVVQETVRFLSALTVSRRFEMVNVITADALPILGDRIQLQQVILNLVLNGVEAMKDTSHESRTISIRTARADQFAELSVSDRGPGIPEDKLKQVFEPFYTSKAEGMGMGLSIARTIIEAHNGFISASNREHGGASFTIRLPFVG